MPRNNATASAPGKLILCGEHAVVYGRPALVAAVDLRLTTRLTVPGDGGRAGADAPVRLSVPVLDLESETTWGEIHRYADDSRRRWRRWAEDRGEGGEPPRPFSTVRADAPDHLLKVALGEAAAALGEAGSGKAGSGKGGPPLEVHVDSDLTTGSGFGSSAAAAVTLVAAYLELRGDAPVDLELVERLALEVERRQHGSPSGVDGATVLHGGMVWAEQGADGDLHFHPFATAGGGPLATLAVYDTGRPAEGTGTVVAAVRRSWQRETARHEALWDEMEAATRAFRAILDGGGDGDGDALARVIRRSQRALEGIGVVPEPVRRLVRTVEEAGGAAKISGAGSLAGPGAGTLLVHHPEPAVLDGLPPLSILPRFPVRLGAPGLRFDPVPQETP